MPGDLLAISDLHVGYQANRAIVEAMAPEHPDDWLIVAGDVGEYAKDVEWALRTLAGRYATVIWTPGNHELWTPPDDPVTLRGEARYRHLVEFCRSLGVVTPEDPYPVWPGKTPVTVAPLFTLYDYSFLPAGAHDLESAMSMAYAAGIVCADEFYLHPDPYPSRQDWCASRIEFTERRLAERDPALQTVLVNHHPLVRDPAHVLRHPEFVLWVGTQRTADWHVRYDAAVAVYGHLHIPRSTVYDGVPFEEVSLGYPREWGARAAGPAKPRPVLTNGSGAYRRM